jgi:predicted SpoU family rRNA methylase
MIITTTTTVATFGANNIVCQQGEVLHMMCVINFVVSFWTCNFVVFRFMG